jgi:hypothetical protein
VSNEGHLVQGQRVTMPVEIRAATAAVAMYSAPAAVAQSIVDYSGLRVLQYRPGKTICSVLFVNYVDGDLGKYHEYGVGFLVRHPGSPARTGDLRSLLRGRAGVFIHRLPVDQAFTLEAGRSIWGFPKVMSEIDLADTGHRAALRIDGRLVADLAVTPGLPVPGASTSLDAYTHMDGVLRRVPWKMTASGTRTRPGGARLELGDHPWAEELAALGLPKRAMLSTTIACLQMGFDEAEIV